MKPTDNWLSVTIEEYKSIRTESLDAIKNQHSIIKMGAGAISALIAVAFYQWDEQPLSEIILLLFNPILCYLIIIIWIGEVARMMRAGFFLSKRERTINDFLSNEYALTWENWLRDKKAINETNQNVWNYIAVLTLYYGIALGSIIVGFYRIYGELSSTIYYVIIWFAEFFAMVSSIVLTYKVGVKFRTM